ncbi:MAG: phosphoribosylamine--glycine ligase [Beutenbergiaceae bacterium]
MRILIIGTGAREHALARSLALDPTSSAIVVAPGNPGTAGLPKTQNMPVAANEPNAVADLAQQMSADLVVVGPEAPLVAGVADAVRARGIPVFGPDAAAARIEGSKAFAKEVMAASGVPTAMARVCSTLAQVEQALDGFGAPYVVKDDGLAAGKGVVVTDDREAALSHARACLEHSQVVVEEYLDGPEVSLFCLADGHAVVPLAPAQDFKRLRDGDAGPNTGGMGAYSPLTWAPEGLTTEVVQRVAQPAISELARRGTPFVGLLYCGLALTSRGLRVVEFNARFGDPETQVVLARLTSSLATALYAAATGALAQLPPLTWSEDAAVTVVVASAGYPASSRSGDLIAGVADADALAGVHVLHAGTGLADGSLVTAGGRVLSVVGVGADVAAARSTAYAGIAAITIDGGQYRSDIAGSIAAG